MVKYYTDSLDVVFMALADSTRRAILAKLADGESTMSELAEPFDMSLPAVSKHVRILENAGLLTREKQGRIFLCTLDAAPMQEAAEWLTRYRAFWEQQFDALDAYLRRTQKKETKDGSSDKESDHT